MCGVVIDNVRVDSAMIYIISESMRDIMDRLHDSRFAVRSVKEDRAGSSDDTSAFCGAQILSAATQIERGA